LTSAMRHYGMHGQASAFLKISCNINIICRTSSLPAPCSPADARKAYGAAPHARADGCAIIAQMPLPIIRLGRTVLSGQEGPSNSRAAPP
jgi:hypothetical protein